MSSEDIGAYEADDIKAITARLLRDLGNPEPPLNLSDVRELLKIDLGFYSTAHPQFLEELTHKAKLTWKRDLKGALTHLKSALLKSKLSAFWVPDGKNILIDEEVPDLKRRWIEAHEISHSLIPWHSEFLLGDTLQTLDPTCHAIIEAEANFGAGRLIFLHEKFAREARDVAFTFKQIKILAERYGNSIQSTLWRMVEDRHPQLPSFAMVSIHPRFPALGKHDGPDPWRYFVRSPMFRTQFRQTEPKFAYEIVKRNCGFKKRGPIFETNDVLIDDNGAFRTFRVECFSTGHALLTFGLEE